MKRRIVAFFLVIIFISIQSSLVYAKRSSGGRSFGGYSGSSSSRNSSSFSSYSKNSTNNWSSSSSSKSKSFGGWSGSSSSSSKSSTKQASTPSSPKSSASTQRNTLNSYSAGNTTTYKGSGTKTDTLKSSYMQNYYNKETSKNNYNTYKQSLNTEQQRVYDTTMKNNYNVGNKMNFEDAVNSKSQRISTYNSVPPRVHVNSNYFGGPLSYGSAFVGIWDLWFLLRASDLFWYHHWNDIYPYRNYFDPTSFAAKEAAVKQMESQGIAKDASYLDANVSPDLQFSNDYVKSHLNSIYHTNKYARPNGHPILTFFIIIIIIAVLVFIIRRMLKKKPVESYNSSIY